MNRREAIQRASLVLGYAITGPVLTGVLQGCKASPELAYKPVFFSEDQALLISELSEIIIPRTSTPGAIDAGVPGFIDQMIREVYTKEQQESFLKGLAEFDAEAKKEYNDSFIACSAEQRVAFTKKQHDATFAKGVEGGSAGWWNTKGGGDKPFILKVKELTILGFFTSESGATKVLQYNQVPGPYKGCLPLAEVGKTWAT